MRLSLHPVNEGVVAVRLPGDIPAGHLKWIGGVWKFKAMGLEGGVPVPGGGPLTAQHNRCFETLDEAAINTALLALPPSAPFPLL